MKPLEERLVDAAESLIGRHGAQAFSLREAARRVKVDPAMVYRHFQNRADLTRAVADRGFARLKDRMLTAVARLPAGAGPDRKVRLLGQSYLEFAIDEPALFNLMFGPHRGPSVSGDQTPLALLEQALAQLHAQHPLRLEVKQAAVVCWAGMFGVAQLILSGALERTVPGSDPAAAGHMLDVLLSGLLREPR